MGLLPVGVVAGRGFGAESVWTRCHRAGAVVLAMNRPTPVGGVKSLPGVGQELRQERFFEPRWVKRPDAPLFHALWALSAHLQGDLRRDTPPTGAFSVKKP